MPKSQHPYRRSLDHLDDGWERVTRTLVKKVSLLSPARRPAEPPACVLSFKPTEERAARASRQTAPAAVVIPDNGQLIRRNVAGVFATSAQSTDAATGRQLVTARSESYSSSGSGRGRASGEPGVSWLRRPSENGEWAGAWSATSSGLSQFTSVRWNTRVSLCSPVVLIRSTSRQRTRPAEHSKPSSSRHRAGAGGATLWPRRQPPLGPAGGRRGR